MTEAEGQVPFAYSVLNHANIGLLEALLSAIFRPHNSYCIYIDAKASETHKVKPNEWIVSVTVIIFLIQKQPIRIAGEIHSATRSEKNFPNRPIVVYMF